MCAKLASPTVNRLACDSQDPRMPPEISKIGRTIWRWRTQISNLHASRVSNGQSEAAINLIKRVKQASFEFINFDNYRIRTPLYARKPSWALLNALTPPQFAKHRQTQGDLPAPLRPAWSAAAGGVHYLRMSVNVGRVGQTCLATTVALCMVLALDGSLTVSWSVPTMGVSNLWLCRAGTISGRHSPCDSADRAHNERDDHASHERQDLQCLCSSELCWVGSLV